MTNIHNCDKSGYKAWLVYNQATWTKPNPNTVLFDSICADPVQKELEVAVEELKEALTAISGKIPELVSKPTSGNTVLIHLIPQRKTLKTADTGNGSESDGYISDSEACRLDNEGFIIKSCQTGGADCTVIAAKTGAGALYGVFALIRHILCGTFDKNAYIVQNPAIKLACSISGTIWTAASKEAMPAILFLQKRTNHHRSEKSQDYARLMASVGLNSIVLNNVNVHGPETRR